MLTGLSLLWGLISLVKKADVTSSICSKHVYRQIKKHPPFSNLSIVLYDVPASSSEIIAGSMDEPNLSQISCLCVPVNFQNRYKNLR